MEMLLKKEAVWKTITEDPPAATDTTRANRIEKDEKAMALI